MQTNVRGTRRSRLLRLAGIAGLVLVLSGCADSAPYDTLDPEGPLARQIDDLFMPVFWIATAVFVVVEGLIVYALIRFRRRPGNEAPRQIHGNFRLEITLTALPLILLLGISVPTVATVLDMSEEPDGALTVDVIGHQWWWEFRYPGTGVITANEMYMPVGRPVVLRMRSVDVIHSFWVPKLNGKRDVIPGQLQSWRLEASEPGEYLGQCAEFCGASHANMRMKAIALPPADFDTWLDEQAEEAATPADGTAAANGRGLFEAKGCAGCHAVKGFAQGRVGPDLTHFASRSTFAGAIFDNTPAELAAWLRNPPGEKPGSLMPNLKLTEDEIADLVAYLETLK